MTQVLQVDSPIRVQWCVQQILLHTGSTPVLDAAAAAADARDTCTLAMPMLDPAWIPPQQGCTPPDIPSEGGV